ncbi:MAG: metallophosphoesterase [Magnetococcales bacterium]|nr:metallophosphoesterase [Magnetococcales bacterium]
MSTPHFTQSLLKLSKPKSLQPSFWDKVHKGIQATIDQYQNRVAHPVLLEIKENNSCNISQSHVDFPVDVEEPPLQASPEWSLVLSDTDNDIQTTIYALWLTGLCDEYGNWNPGLPNIQVVHTGDWLNKWRPSHQAVAFFKNLQQSAPIQCPVKLLNGNHELAILHMYDNNFTSPLTEDDIAFIRNQDIIHVTSDTLFLHGYPTLNLANILLQMKREELALADFPARLHNVFYAKNRPLYSEPQGMEIIGDLRRPKFYYEKQLENYQASQGQETAEILQKLGVNTVVHGHKPNNNVQIDQELAKQIPGIRLVNNDNRCKQTGMGGMLINRDSEIIFLNPTTMKDAGGEKGFRKLLKKRLKTRRKDLGLPSKKLLRQKPNLALVA